MTNAIPPGTDAAHAEHARLIVNKQDLKVRPAKIYGIDTAFLDNEAAPPPNLQMNRFLFAASALVFSGLFASCEHSTFRPPEREGPPALVQQEKGAASLVDVETGRTKKPASRR